MIKTIRRITWIILTQFFIYIPTTSAFTQIYNTYVGVKVVSPVGEAKDYYSGGWGVSGTSYFKILPPIDFLFEASWYNLSGKEVIITGQRPYQVEDLSVLGLAVGAGYNISFFQIGIKGGYFFDDLHEWDLLPYAQVNFWRLLLGVDYKGFFGSKNVESIAIYLSYRLW